VKDDRDLKGTHGSEKSIKQKNRKSNRIPLKMRQTASNQMRTLGLAQIWSE